MQQSHPAPTKKPAKPTNVVNRLIEYGQIVEQKKEIIRKDFGKGSFQPQINENAGELSHNRSTIGGGRLSEVAPDLSQSMRRSQAPAEPAPAEKSEAPATPEPAEPAESAESSHQRDPSGVFDYSEDIFQSEMQMSGGKQPSRQMLKHIEEQESKCPFRPQILERPAKKAGPPLDQSELKDSRGELEEPESVHDRLYGLSLTPSKHAEKELSFHPEINRNSQQIVGLMQEGDDYNQRGRWNALYQYGTEKQQMRNALAKVVDEKRDAEEASKHSFRPEITAYGDQEQQADVVT